MVAVGDDQLFVGHGGYQQAYDGRIADAPNAVNYAVFVGNFGVGGSGAVVGVLDATGRVRVEHEDLAEVGVSGLEQIKAIAFWFGESLLMAKDNLVSVIVELAEGDETTTFLNGIGTWDAESLRICQKCTGSLSWTRTD